MQLDLLPHARVLATRTSAGGPQLWCPVRKLWLAHQPEELVRLALIAYLGERAYPLTLMQVERRVGRGRDRLDLLVYDREAAPFLLVEAKAPGYDLRPAVRQLARYNRALRAPYALAVNGEEAVACAFDFEAETLKPLDRVPAYPVDKST